MAITGTIAVAALATSYSIYSSEQAKKQQNEQLDKQEADQNRLATEAKQKEQNAIQSAFNQRAAGVRKAQAKSGSLGVSDSIGGAQVAGTKTTIGQ